MTNEPKLANEPKLLDYLKRVTAELHETQERLAELEDAQTEPIAVVGMSCRFPGGVGSPEELWRLVDEGADAVTGFPDDRGWDLDELTRESSVQEGAFLDGADHFDAGFFGISPREATAMDPQQRLLLETGWEALERAGLDPLTVRGTRTGVFVGSNNQDHVIVVAGAGSDVAGQGVTGATQSVLSGRVAYFLGTEGPAVTVDTACSSSLVSVHLAMDSLRRGESTLAMAGGVALMATPAMFVEAGRQGALASDGRCKAFSAEADGTGWGEGVGWLLLERLSDARRNGRTILAVVRGSAVNQDGASNGLTAPSGAAQQRVISDALADAGLGAADVDAVEAHGTGTALGDPIEAQALLATYGRAHSADRPLWLGSLKSNVGHTQAAAGVGGLIKMVMALRHGELPRTLHADRRTDEVDWSARSVELLTDARPWPETGAPRRAAVSSFGVSGTNAHIVLEQAAETETGAAAAESPVAEPDGPLPWLLSARSEPGLRGQARSLLDHAESHPELSAADIGLSLATTRSTFDNRAVVLGADRDELLRGLRALAEGESAANVVTGTAAYGDRVAFVFPGFGSQWPRMAAGLLESAPAFRAEFEACEAAFAPHVGYSLTDVVRGAPDAPEMAQVEVAQVLLFAVMVSLAALWRSYGVEPSAVIGHSQGEIVAACVTGAVSREDAARVVAARSKALQTLAGTGAMASVQMSEDELAPLIETWAGRIEVAAVNGPRAVVITGEQAAIDECAALLDERDVKVRKLPTDVAGHSFYVEGLRGELEQVLATLSPRATGTPLFSTVTGERVDTAALRPAHWFSNVRDTVRFDQATRAALGQGYRLLLEVSPHPVVSMGVEDIAEDVGVAAAVTGTLRRDQGGFAQFLRALAGAHVHGAPVDFTALFAGGRRVDLPTYAFQHERYRLQPAATGDIASIGLVPAGHPLVPAGVTLPASGGLLTGRLSRRSHPWLAEHEVLGKVVVPGSVHLELAFRAGDQVGCGTVEELTLQAPLILPEHGSVAIQVHVGAIQESGNREISIHSRPDGGVRAEDQEWTCHAVGSLGTAAGTTAGTTAAADAGTLAEWPPPGARPLPVEGLYERLGAAGFGYGEVFRGLRAAWRRGQDVFAEVTLSEQGEGSGYGLHPALLDSAFHALFAAQTEDDGRPMRMLFAWSGVRLLAAGATALRVRLTLTGDDSMSMLATDGQGEPVAVADGLVVREVTAAQLAAAAAAQSGSLFRPQWTATSPDAEPDDGEVCRFDLAEWPVPPAPVLVVDADACEPGPELNGPELTGPELTGRFAKLVDEFLADDRYVTSTLVVRTRSAVALDGEQPDLGLAALPGVVRAAASPRVRLTDHDGTAASRGVLGTVDGEPVTAVREGAVHVPRLARVAPPTEPVPPRWTGTVLVTGTGDERTPHLVDHFHVLGAEHVVLAGAFDECPGADVRACETRDRDALAALLAELPGPLGAVVCTDPADSQTPGHLDELVTSDAPFVLFASADGLFGGEDAPTTAFAAALAAHRRASGRNAVALPWGSWPAAGLSAAEAMELLDTALALDDPCLVPMRLRPAADGAVDPLLKDLVHRPARRTSGASAPSSGFGSRLSALPQAERLRAVVDLVRTEAAVVLGYAGPEAIPAGQKFRDLGFASITAVELRGRLAAATGLALPATLVFDHPSATALGEKLLELVLGTTRSAEPVRAAAPADEPVAVVGMSCRFPGGVGSPEDLWRLVADGTDAITGMPDDRGWDLEALYDPDPDAVGTSYVREGGFVDGAGTFDAGFFGISPREALAMDPQQRLLMETVWEAIERAGINPASLRGSDTGVFVGSNGQDHAIVLADADDALAGYRATGVSASVMSGRISYTLGVEGPAMTVDTACSSSLVSLHLAAQSLRGGECSLALAGGCSILSTPTQFVEFSKQGALAPDGRSKAYAAGGDGFAVSEGAGWVVLERLSDARRNGHRVLAVMKGSAVNQDGASNGLTAPNGPAQQRVIRQALGSAGLSAGEIDAVEGHGTGTALGDPIEVQALLATYGREHDREQPLWLGSLKSNLGHAQAAAGVAGVIKTVLALNHSVLPKTLHVTEPTHEVDWSGGAVEVLTEARPWPDTGRPRRAGVSAFGISGTNAHVILEQGQAQDRDQDRDRDQGRVQDQGQDRELAAGQPAAGPVPWVLSARSERALRAQAGRLAAHAGDRPDLSVQDIARSLTETRETFEHRAVVVGADRDELVRGLTALAAGEPAANVVRGTAAHGGRVAFVFPGQGSQWAGMALELYDSSAAFREEFTACCASLAPWIDFRPVDVLRGAEGAPGLDRVDVVQPMLWAVMVSLAALWRAHGVEPAAVLGHSQGEIAAAAATGALSRDDAAKVVALRSRALTRIAGTGGMMSVQLGRDEVTERIAPRGDRLSVAAVNGPRAVVLAGEVAALHELHAELVAEDVSARIIPVDYAAHSAQVDGISEELLDLLASVTSVETAVPFHSCVDGARRPTAGLDAEYWRRNLRDTVQFDRSVRGVLDDGVRMLVEASPHPVLSTAVEEIAADAGSEAAAWGTLHRGEGGPTRFLLALAQAHVNGAAVDWSPAFEGTGAALVELPTYAFQGERFWLTASGRPADAAAMGLTAAAHPLLSAEVDLPDSGSVAFTGRVSLAAQPWLADHVVSGMVILPGTAYMEMAFHAADRVGCESVEELTVQAPLLLSERSAHAVQVVVAAPLETGQRQLTVYARPEHDREELDEAEWTCHATGWLRATAPAGSGPAAPLSWPPEDASHVTADEVYGMLVARDYGYGPVFQGLRDVWVRGREVFAEVSLPTQARSDAEHFGLHPALFDAAFHALIAGQERDREQPLRLPFSWTGVRLFAAGSSVMRVRMDLTSEETVSLTAVDETGRPVVAVDSLLVREIGAVAMPSQPGGGHHRSLFRPEFAPLGVQAGKTGRWAVVGDSPLTKSLTADDSTVAYFSSWADLAAAAEVPDTLVLPVGAPDGTAGCPDVPAAVRRVTADVLALVQDWLSEERFADTRLVVATTHATHATTGDPDLLQAPLWGLLRSAQSENPDRLVLVDLDESADSLRMVPQAVATAVAADEPQLALHAGELLACRLARVPAAAEPAEAPALDPDGTVLITGVSGLLAGHVARHLAASGSRHFALLSRRGDAAPTTARLVADLALEGATATVAACDAADPEALRAAVDAIPEEHPLTAVVHTAGVLDDGVLGSLDPGRVDTVYRPKVDAAWNLHELTRDLPVAVFALFSSAASTLGGGGQGSYAAANMFLDTLAAHRRGHGLAATSMAWGMWEDSGDPDNPGLAGHLGTTDRGRAGRGGLLPVSFEQGMRLFDTAVGLPDPVVLPMRMDISGLRSAGGPIPSLMRGLVKAPVRRAAEAAPQSAAGLTDRLATLSRSERERFLLDLVRGQAAAVLGYASAHLVPVDEAFRDLGFDSLTAVELRNRLKVATGLTLPATLVFDHPSPRALCAFLLGELGDGETEDVAPAQAELDRLEAALAAAPAQDAGDERVARRLKKILDSWTRARASDTAAPAAAIGTASVDDLLAYIDNDLGRSRA
ncbi:SDR family NAD(P)-dependent oxidoreductase [Streptomyces sp. HNM0575]|uniref:type I polyketide synthase n=1 Tax=Streptomyces sp. HNM0575 TaxID=2716338 RepID=UPI00145F7E82|nr:type I polyketide synthase [Streptomyces sp. HNM0575]NLU76573.1 SDR family NAD(P)-dependent oxidoreductase [Streptomyces sp. HNM0575]